MKKTRLFFVAGVFALCFQHNLFAKALAPQIGSIQKYYSADKQFVVEIKILSYPDNSPSECTVRQGDKMIWSKRIPTTLGKVSISNNGQSIVMANWGWYDEGGYKSLSFYSNKGDLIKEITLGDSKRYMEWVREAAISNDGKLFAMAVSGPQKPTLFLYDAQTAALLWKKEFGSGEVDRVEISNEDDLILAASFQYDSGDMQFNLLDKEGSLLWQEKIDKNHDWDVKDFLHFKDGGKDFEIFDRASGKYIYFKNKSGKISRQ